MDIYKIEGNRPLRGEVKISGSKNSCLPLMFASLLTNDTFILESVPNSRDIRTTLQLMPHLGKQGLWKSPGDLILQRIHDGSMGARAIPYRLVKQMRASVLAAGPMLARYGKAIVSMPGGCAIGLRPIDIHLEGFKAMGAALKISRGNVCLSAKRGKLRAANIKLPFQSVGATENLILAATLAKGTTRLSNCAKEPEIADMCNALNKMGANIAGIGTSSVAITGVTSLRGAIHKSIPDRIETGTFAFFAACTKGSLVRINTCNPAHLKTVWEYLQRAGVKLKFSKNSVEIRTSRNFRPKPVPASTGPYPQFPTDLQPLWIAFMSQASGNTRFKETIFESRFLHIAEMKRMGAQIYARGTHADIKGIPQLSGAQVMAGDIRGGAGLMACALAAKGTTTISRIYHIDRGHEFLEGKLKSLGAKIERLRETI
ncbi:UDP-N-acetylglucosamine 1-carboxyvinyltransferase [Elusimicrobiota bacterium]